MTLPIEQKVSTLVRNQFPSFYEEEGENFILFVKAYYEFLEQSGYPLHETRNLLQYKDLDDTTEQFLEYIRRTVLADIPEDVLADKRLLAKRIKDFYQSKGTLSSYKLLFRILYNEDVEINYPADQILKVSDGDWRIDQYVVTPHDKQNLTFIGKTIKGVDSGAEALVENIVKRAIRGRVIDQIYLSNIKGTFQHLEPVILVNGDSATSHTPIIDAGINNFTIISPGAQYAPGDVVELLSGVSGQFGKVVVTTTEDLGNVLTFSLLDGGSGYSSSINDSTVIEIIGGDGTEPASFTIARSDLNDTYAISQNINKVGSNNIFGELAPVVTYPLTVNSQGERVAPDQATGIMDIFANTILGSPQFGFQEQGEEVTSGVDFRTNVNAVINIANTNLLPVGTILIGSTSGANGIVTEIIDPTDGDAWVHLDTYRDFSSAETVTVGGSSVGTVSSFQSNTVGYHTLRIGLVTGQSISEGDEIRGAFGHWGPYDDKSNVSNEPKHATGIVKSVGPSFTKAYLHDGTSNTVFSEDDPSSLGGTVSSSANTVTGIGTTFTSDFIIGHEFKAGGQVGRRIVSITDDATLELDSVPSPALSGDTYGRGGFYRDIVVVRVVANNTSNTSNSFDRGPLPNFLETEGIYKVGSTTLVGNVEFGSANTIVENVYTKLSDSLLFEAATIGTIFRLSNRNGGEGFSTAPTVRVVDTSVAALGIGESYLTLQWDDVNLQTGNSQVTAIDDNDKIKQANTGASAYVKDYGAVIQYANNTYEQVVRVWQDVSQRDPGEIFFANNQHADYLSYGSGYTQGGDIPDNRTILDVGTVHIVSVQDEGVLGKNAVIDASVGANGTITGLRVIDSGFNYNQNELVSLRETTRADSSQATIRLGLSGAGNTEGYYATSRSHLDSKRGFIQDSYFYQEFSYQIQASVSLSRYRDVILDLVHPAGQIFFGRFKTASNVNVNAVVSDYSKKRVKADGTVSISRTAASGTIAIENGNTHIVGTSTDFENEFNININNFIIEIDPGDEIENQFIEVTGTIYSSSNTVLSEPWTYDTQTSANVYYANTSWNYTVKKRASGTIAIQNGNTHVVGTSTDFENEFIIRVNNFIIEIDPGDGIENQFIEVTSRMNSSTNTVLTTPWVYDTQTSANVYYANNNIVVGSSTTLSTDFDDGDTMIVEVDSGDGIANKFYSVTLNNVRSATEANTYGLWNLPNVSGANIYYYTGSLD